MTVGAHVGLCVCLHVNVYVGQAPRDVRVGLEHEIDLGGSWLPIDSHGGPHTVWEALCCDRLPPEARARECSRARGCGSH